MFRDMRLKGRRISEKACFEILENGTSGVLAVWGDEGYPYAVPLSYVFDGGKIYFHSAKKGHKIDAVSRNDKASFCVVARDCSMAEKYTTLYTSVIAFGRAAIVADEQLKRYAIEKLAQKYAPNDDEIHRKKAINEAWDAFCILEFTIESISGKSSQKDTL